MIHVKLLLLSCPKDCKEVENKIWGIHALNPDNVNSDIAVKPRLGVAANTPVGVYAGITMTKEEYLEVVLWIRHYKICDWCKEKSKFYCFWIAEINFPSCRITAYQWAPVFSRYQSTAMGNFHVETSNSWVNNALLCTVKWFWSVFWEWCQ